VPSAIADRPIQARPGRRVMSNHHEQLLTAASGAARQTTRATVENEQ
jgi:hypothetical protein